MPRKRYKVAWTGPALEQLLSIIHYVKQDDPEAARRLGQKIRASTFRLSLFPYLGRTVPEFPRSGLREILTGNYRVIYRVRRESCHVQILTVFHGSRQLGKLQED